MSSLEWYSLNKYQESEVPLVTAVFSFSRNSYGEQRTEGETERRSCVRVLDSISVQAAWETFTLRLLLRGVYRSRHL